MSAEERVDIPIQTEEDLAEAEAAQDEDLETALDQAQEEAPEEVDPFTAVTRERDELQDKLLRLAAEMENYKKRSEREKAEFFKRANQNLLKELLPILDNLDRAIDHCAVDENGGGGDEGLAEGVCLVRDELWKVISRHGVEEIEALGKPFDPELHEAMMQQEDPSLEENTVLEQMQKGYLHEGRLLRPAMVIVSKKPAGD